MKTKFQAGDRVALSAQFLKSTGQRTGFAAHRRGSFLKIEGTEFARVRWDDEGEVLYSAMALQWGNDYADDIRANGSLININNLAKVGANTRFCAC